MQRCVVASTRMGVDFVVDGVGARRVSVNAVPASRSGVLAARSIRAASGEADCWVVALGTNDINSGVTTPTRARATIAEMLAEIPTPARVWWVNVDFRSIEGAALDYPAITQMFNAVLSQRDAADARFRVIDWYTLAREPSRMVRRRSARDQCRLHRSRCIDRGRAQA